MNMIYFEYFGMIGHRPYEMVLDDFLIRAVDRKPVAGVALDIEHNRPVFFTVKEVLAGRIQADGSCPKAFKVEETSGAFHQRYAPPLKSHHFESKDEALAFVAEALKRYPEWCLLEPISEDWAETISDDEELKVVSHRWQMRKLTKARSGA